MIEQILRSLNCPECGASIKFEGKSVVQCEFCDSTIQLIEGLDDRTEEEEELKQLLEENALKAQEYEATIAHLTQKIETFKTKKTEEIRARREPKRAVSSMGASLRALPICITEDMTGATIRSSIPNINSEIFSYQVPLGMHVVLREGDDYFMQLYDDSDTPVEVTKGTYQVVKSDPIEINQEIVSQGRLEEFRGDMYENRVPKFPMDICIRQGFKLIVKVKSDNPVSYFNSNFMFKGVQLVERL